MLGKGFFEENPKTVGLCRRTCKQARKHCPHSGIRLGHNAVSGQGIDEPMRGNPLTRAYAEPLALKHIEQSVKFFVSSI